jgi:hypothetical protein
MGVIWLYPVPILFDRFNSYVEPITTPYILPLTQMALTGNYKFNICHTDFLTITLGSLILPNSSANRSKIPPFEIDDLRN